MVRSKAGRPAGAKAKNLRVQFGSRNAMGPVVHYANDADLRKRVDDVVKHWKEWCMTYNREGLESLQNIVDTVSSVAITSQPVELRAEFDKHSGMTLVVRFWREEK